MTTESVPRKRHRIEIIADVKMGTAPEDKRALFEEIKDLLADTVTVHYSDFFTVAPGKQCFQFIISADEVSSEVARMVCAVIAHYVLGDDYPHEVFLRG